MGKSNNPLRHDYSGRADETPLSRPAKLVIGGGFLLAVALAVPDLGAFGLLVAVVGVLILLAGLVGYANR